MTRFKKKGVEHPHSHFFATKCPEQSCFYCWESQPPCDLLIEGQLWHSKCKKIQTRVQQFFAGKLVLPKKNYKGGATDRLTSEDQTCLTDTEETVFYLLCKWVHVKKKFSLEELAKASFVCYASVRKIVKSLDRKGWIKFNGYRAHPYKYIILKK